MPEKLVNQAPQTGTNADPFLNNDEAAAYLNVSPGTLPVWRCTGRHNLRYTKIGRKPMYRRSWLDEFANARIVEFDQDA